MGVSKVLVGEYEHSVDLKGRLIMPAKLREGLGDKFIVTKGLDGCLFVYSLEEWQNFENKLSTLPLTNKDSRMFIRTFFAGAIQCEVDKQGRILITNNLREYAGLTKDVVIIGALTRVEIWDKEKWKNISKDENSSPDEIAEKMSIFGI